MTRSCLLVLLLLPGIAAATQWQSLDEISEVAAQYARSTYANASRTATAGALDSRLRLKNCAGALQAFLPPGSKPGANMTVGVRCAAGESWKVFVPVRSTLTGMVLVSRHSLQRGQQISSNDVQLARHDIDRLPYGYLTDLTQLENRVLRRPVAPGAVIIPPMLDQAQTIRRGQTVTLFADQAGIQIQMAGRALTNAALQQRVRVENLSSGRVVEGIVRSDERVEILTN